MQPGTLVSKQFHFVPSSFALSSSPQNCSVADPNDVIPVRFGKYDTGSWGDADCGMLRRLLMLFITFDVTSTTARRAQ